MVLKLLKWHFYATVVGKLMPCADYEEAALVLDPAYNSVQYHTPCSVTKIYSVKKYPPCMMCLMEEVIMYKYSNTSRTNWKIENPQEGN